MTNDAPTVVDASGAVMSALQPYQQQFVSVGHQILGDPSSIVQTMQTYQDGHQRIGALSSDLDAMATGVRTHWTGSASTAAQNHAQRLDTRLIDAQALLKQQADSLDRVHSAYSGTMSELQDQGRAFDQQAAQLRQAASATTPDRVPVLQLQAQLLGQNYTQAATELKTNLAQVMTEEAAKLRGAQAATPVATAAQTRPKLADFQQMYNQVLDCVRQMEQRTKRALVRGSDGKPVKGPNGKPVYQDVPAPPTESNYRTVAGPRASMATPTQTTVPNAITTLRYSESANLRNSVNPPLTMNELNRADSRAIAIAKVHEQAANHAGSLLADPDKFARDNAASTGLNAGDLKNMLLAAAEVHKSKLTAAQQTQLNTLQGSLAKANNLRVNADTLTTLRAQPGEDLAGWQRLGADNLVVAPATQSVGARINTIATAGDHNGIGEIALKRYLSDARAAYDKGRLASEADVVQAAAYRQNHGTVPHNGKKVWYPGAIRKCYEQKQQKATPATTPH